MNLLKMHSQKKCSGFTLIELIIVIFIVATMSAVVLSNVNSGSTEKQIEAGGRNVASQLHELKQYSLTGKQFVTNTAPCLYQMNWNSGSANYTTRYWYKTGNVCDQSATIATYTLPNSITFQNSGSIGFTLPHGELNPAGASFGMAFAKSGVLGVACVYDGGRIEDIAGTNSCP
jgi:prepilin-type N-terminal cleavage/methylation domain-containing protein